MKILVNNLAFPSNTTITTGSDNYPATNMFGDQLVTVTQMENAVIDLGEATRIKAVSIISDYDITLEANTSDSWGSPAYSLEITDIYHLIDETYRYWRVVLTTPDAEFFVNYLFLGEYLNFDCIVPGSEPQPETTDIVSFTSGGQVYTTPGVVYNTQSISLEAEGVTSWSAFDIWYRTNDRTHPHMIVPWEDNAYTYDYWVDNFGDQYVDENGNYYILKAIGATSGAFFGYITRYVIDRRQSLNYDFTIDFREAK